MQTQLSLKLILRIHSMFQTTETVYQAYKRLDQQICTLEGTCPGPRLTTAEAWIEFLESEQHKHMMQGNQFLQNQNQNDPLDFRESEDRIDKEKSNIRKVVHIMRWMFFFNNFLLHSISASHSM